MAVNEYKLPDVGEGLTEAEIVTWMVKIGDVIKVNDVVVEIETAKSLVELPSPYAGTVTALLVNEGDTVFVGTPMISVDDGTPAQPGESALADTSRPGQGGESALMDTSAMDLSNPSAGAENQTLVGYGPKSGSAMRRARRGPATAHTLAGSAAQLQVQGVFEQPGVQTTTEVVPADEPVVPAVAARLADRPATSTSAWSVGGVLAKPLVRKRAKELGVDLGSVTPSGPNATVSLLDVEAAAGMTPSADSPAVGRVASEASVSRPSTLADRREPIKGVRKMMGAAMVESAFTMPHVTEWITVDVTRTMKLVDRLKDDREFADAKVSPLLLLARAVCLAMRRTPEINAMWDEAAQEIVFRGAVNLGIAAATPRGLVVPNVKGADTLSLRELAGELTKLTGIAKDGKTQPADMAGGSFTITNVGVFGVDAGTPIINPGEGAILCFGAVRKQPWVHKDKLAIRQITTLALSFDHRFIDGAKGSRFLADVASILERPDSSLKF